MAKLLTYSDLWSIHLINYEVPTDRFILNLMASIKLSGSATIPYFDSIFQIGRYEPFAADYYFDTYASIKNELSPFCTTAASFSTSTSFIG